MRQFEAVLGWDANHSGDGSGTIPSLPLALQSGALLALARRIPHLPPSQRMRGIQLFAAAEAAMGSHGGPALGAFLQVLERAQLAARRASRVENWFQFESVFVEFLDVDALNALPPEMAGWPLAEVGYRIPLLPVERQAEAIGVFRGVGGRVHRHATPEVELLRDALSMPADFRRFCVAVAAARAGADLASVARTYGVAEQMLEFNAVRSGRAGLEAKAGESLADIALTYRLSEEGLRALAGRRFVSGRAPR